MNIHAVNQSSKLIIYVWDSPYPLVQLLIAWCRIIKNENFVWIFPSINHIFWSLELKYHFVSLPCFNQSKVQSQLWISGLFPSAYWCGQALVDVPMYSLSFLLMYLIDYGLNFDGTLITLISEIIQVSDHLHRTNIIVCFNESIWRGKLFALMFTFLQIKSL